MTLVESRIPDDLGDPRIENRRFGLDKRLIWPTVGVLILVVFWSAFVPWLDEAVEGDPLDPTTPIELAGGVEFTPAEGWQASGAVFPGSNSLTIFRGGVTFTIAPGGWGGSPDELLDELVDRSDHLVLGDRLGVSLPVGEGVGVDTYGEDDEGFLLAIVSGESFDGGERFTAISIEAHSPVDYSPEDQEDVAEMIASITVTPFDERTATAEEEGQ